MPTKSPVPSPKGLPTLKDRLAAYAVLGELWRTAVELTTTYRKGALSKEFEAAFAHLDFEEAAFGLPHDLAIKMSVRAVGYLAAGRPDRLKIELDLVREQRAYYRAARRDHINLNDPRPLRDSYDDPAKYQDALDEWEAFHEEVESLKALEARSAGVEHYLRNGLSLWLAKVDATDVSPAAVPALKRAPSIFLAAFKRVATSLLRDLNADAGTIEIDPRDPASADKILSAADTLVRRLAKAESGQPTKGQLWLSIAKAASDNGEVTGGDAARQALTAPRLDLPFTRVKVSKTDQIEVIVAKLLFAVLALDAADPGWELKPFASSEDEDGDED